MPRTFSITNTRVKRDKRRYLYRVFLDYVSAFRPRVFVMENVLGIQSAAKGKFFTLVQSDARKLGYRVHAQVEEAWKLGVPQKRRRQLVIGVRNDVPGYFATELKASSRAIPLRSSRREEAQTSEAGQVSLVTSAATFTLWDAIGDLPPLVAGEGVEEMEYDLARRKEFLATRGESAKHFLNEVLQIARATKLTAHRARPHNDRDLGDFARLREGENADQAIARGEKMEFPYDRSVFLDRYTRQHRDRLCSTIVAHLAKDGLMFIHPTQNRSLTPREAARVQSFPDWFQFPVARTHQFRIIGNAVPPLVAEAVGCELLDFLGAPSSSPARIETESVRQKHAGSETGAPMTQTRQSAALELQSLAKLDRRDLRALPAKQFLHGWRALLFLFPGISILPPYFFSFVSRIAVMPARCDSMQ